MSTSHKVHEFIKKFRYCLFSKIINDPDINVSIIKNNNIFNSKHNNRIHNYGKEIKCNYFRKKITKIDIDKLLHTYNSNINKLLTNEFSIEEDDVDYIYNATKDDSIIDSLSSSHGIIWTDALIDKYIDLWDWSYLSRNTSVKWDKHKIDKYHQYIDFNALCYNVNIKVNKDVIEDYSSFWNWNALSGNPKVAIDLGDYIFKNPNFIWVSVPKMSSRSYSTGEYHRRVENLNEMYNLDRGRGDYINDWGDDFNINPCICTNPSIKWTDYIISKHIDKIDFWLISLFGNIGIEEINKYKEWFKVNYIYKIVHTKYSDWTDKYPVYRNAFTNLFLNENIYNSKKLIALFKNDVTPIVQVCGSTSHGFTEYKTECKITELIPNGCYYNLDFNELCEIYTLLPYHVINQTKIDHQLYKHVIKPELINNEEIINKILKIIYEEEEYCEY